MSLILFNHAGVWRLRLIDNSYLLQLTLDSERSKSDATGTPSRFSFSIIGPWPRNRSIVEYVQRHHWGGTQKAEGGGEL